MLLLLWLYQVQVQLEHERRGDVSLVLTSPDGTRSNILSNRPLDNSSAGVNFTFMTIHHWGEEPAGTWTLQIGDRIRGDTPSYSRRRGRLLSWGLILYGVAGERPNHHSTGNSASEIHGSATGIQMNAIDPEHARHVGTSEVKELMEEEEASSDAVQIQSKDEMKQNDRRRKWLQKKGFNPKDVDFLMSLFETEATEKKTKSDGDSATVRRKSEIPVYRKGHNYGRSSGDGNKWWERSYGAGRRSYRSPGKRNSESIEADQQRIVDEHASDDEGTESWRELIEELSAILDEH